MENKEQVAKYVFGNNNIIMTPFACGAIVRESEFAGLFLLTSLLN